MRVAGGIHSPRQIGAGASERLEDPRRRREEGWALKTMATFSRQRRLRRTGKRQRPPVIAGVSRSESHHRVVHAGIAAGSTIPAFPSSQRRTSGAAGSTTQTFTGRDTSAAITNASVSQGSASWMNIRE
jgi:hypothetical protein